MARADGGEVTMLRPYALLMARIALAPVLLIALVVSAALFGILLAWALFTLTSIGVVVYTVIAPLLVAIGIGQ